MIYHIIVAITNICIYVLFLIFFTVLSLLHHVAVHSDLATKKSDVPEINI